VEHFVGIVAILAVFGMPVAMLYTVLAHRRQMRLLEIQRIEAEQRLQESRQLSDIPDYVDRTDRAAVEAWREARRELDKATARASVHRQTS
jgi:hypothetical protein